MTNEVDQGNLLVIESTEPPIAEIAATPPDGVEEYETLLNRVMRICDHYGLHAGESRAA